MLNERSRPLVFNPNLAEALITQPDFVDCQLERIVKELAILIEPEDDLNKLRFQSAAILQSLVMSGTPNRQVEAVSTHFGTLQARGDRHLSGDYVDSRTGLPRRKTFFLARRAMLERSTQPVPTAAFMADLRYLHSYNVLLSDEAGDAVKIALSYVLLKVACRHQVVPFINTGDSFVTMSYTKPAVSQKEVESWMEEIDRECQRLTADTMIQGVALGIPIIDRSIRQRICLSADDYNSLISSEAGPQAAQILFPPTITMTSCLLPAEFEQTQTAMTEAMRKIEDIKLSHADELQRRYPQGFDLLQRVKINSDLPQTLRV